MAEILPIIVKHYSNNVLTSSLQENHALKINYEFLGNKNETVKELGQKKKIIKLIFLQYTLDGFTYKTFYVH